MNINQMEFHFEKGFRRKPVPRGKIHYVSPLLLFQYTSDVNGHVNILLIEYPWEKNGRERERVTGQRVISSSPPINDNDLDIDQ